MSVEIFSSFIVICISNDKGPSQLEWTLVMIEVKLGRC